VRLTDMGIAPFLTASTLSCVVAQRLVRRVCTACRREAEVTRDDLRFFGLDRTDLRGLPLVEGAGCAQCNGTGYRGREGVHEVLLPDDDLRDAILARAPSKDLRRKARATTGFFTLQEMGILKAAAGLTTLAEVAANVPRDNASRPPAELRRLVGGKGLL
jgi:type IV pilus assembly protein PilB